MDGMTQRTLEQLTDKGSKAQQGFRPRVVTDIDHMVGARLRTLREQAGVSRRDLSSALSVSTQQLYKYETGVNRISVSFLHSASNVLNVSIHDFLLDRPDGTPGQAPTAAPAPLALPRGTSAEDEQAVLRFVMANIRSPAARTSLIGFLAGLLQEAPQGAESAA